MADDITVDTITGDPVVATDEDGTRHWQYVKLAFGPDNTQTIVGSISSNPLPVALSATDNAVLDTINTAVELIDDAVYVDDGDWTATSSKHQLVGGVYTSSERVLTDGDTGPVSLDVNGHMITSAHAESTALADDVSNSVNLLVDEAGAFVGQGMFPFMFDGSTWDRVRGTSADGLLVNLGGNNDITGTVTANLSATDNAVLDAIAADTAILTAEPVRVAISAASSGNNTLVAAAGASNIIRVTSMFFTANGTVSMRLEDGADGGGALGALTGLMDFVAYTGMSLPHNPNGWFETTANTLLNMELSAAIEVAGSLTYTVVT